MTDLRVGNASGFYGDRFTAWQEMLTGGELDVLTGDYLAELTMLILGRDRLADPSKGYAKTFLRQMADCLAIAVERGVKIVTNAGGLNPAGLADALRELSTKLGVTVRIGHVTGDLVEQPGALTANAYLGAFGIAECLRDGADIVVTGRVTDASLVVGPAIAHFGWQRSNLDALAGATVAGHILECGAQATGGNFAFFTDLPDAGSSPGFHPEFHPEFHPGSRPGFRAGFPSGSRPDFRPGFPIAEISADGGAVITKHAGTGGAVTVETVTAQLLYEIGAPGYLGPDVVARFETIRLAQAGPNRVRVTGVRGSPPPDTVKVGANVLAGYRNQMTFVLCGLDIEAKADLVRRQLESAVGTAGLTWRLARTDHPDPDTIEAACALLTVHIQDTDAVRAGRTFSQAAVELTLASYPGCTLTSAPGDATPYGVFRSSYLSQDAVPHIAVLPSGTEVPIAPPQWTTRTTAPSPEPLPPASQSTTPASQPPTPVSQSTPLASQSTTPASQPPPLASPATPPASQSMPPVSESTTPASPATPVPSSPTRRVALGRLVGARSGDKGGDANLGVWARDEPGYAWLAGFLTVTELKRLLPECAPLPVHRHELPNLRAVNFVIHGLLGAGVAASTRFDPQAKALGEWLRARVVDVPESLL